MTSANLSAPNIDVIIRYHDPNRWFELERCLFSLACSENVNVRASIVCQRFSESEIENLNRLCSDYQYMGQTLSYQVLNFVNEKPLDARSALLNLGIQRTDYDYIAFLDYDDVIYPHAYSLLIKTIVNEDVAMAFGGIFVKNVIQGSDFSITLSRLDRFKKGQIMDLFVDNFCPIHSYVIDRTSIDTRDLYFDERFTRLEDYEFLIRLCAKYPVSFSHLHDFIGDYYWKDDGSNSTLVESSLTEANRKSWAEAAEMVKQTKNKTIVSPSVLRRLGVSDKNKITIEGLVSRHRVDA